MEGLICLFLILLALVAVAVPKRSSCDRQRDDEEQLEYLKEWKKKHERDNWVILQDSEDFKHKG